MNYQDLMYFGYEFDIDSKKNENDFIEQIKERFPNVNFKDVYDSIKGYRQEVYLEESESDNYFAWLIAFGWFELSLTGNLILMDENQRDTFYRYFNLSVKQYPEKFKTNIKH